MKDALSYLRGVLLAPGDQWQNRAELSDSPPSAIKPIPIFLLARAGLPYLPLCGF